MTLQTEILATETSDFLKQIFFLKSFNSLLEASSQPADGFEAVVDSVQSGPQDQKSVTFLHSVISLNQLLQHSKTRVIFS